jgi:hypothetical protein
MQLLYVFPQRISSVVCAARTAALAHIGRGHRYVHVQQARYQASLLPDVWHSPVGEGIDPKGNRMAAVNIRCLEGIDLESVPVQHFDGRSM